MSRVSPQLVVKIKHRLVMHNVTLGVHYVPLSQLQLVNELGEESAGERWVCEDVRGIHGGVWNANPEVNLGLDFDYTPLPAFSRNHFQPLQGLPVSVSLYSDCVCLKVPQIC